MGAVLPGADVCSDGMDQDCNGVVDDGAGVLLHGDDHGLLHGPRGDHRPGHLPRGDALVPEQRHAGALRGRGGAARGGVHGPRRRLRRDRRRGWLRLHHERGRLDAGRSTWARALAAGGATFASHGDPGEYAFSRIPPQMDPGWQAHAPEAISFDDPSTLCGVCECRAGGDFTYFQTSFYVPSSARRHEHARHHPGR